MISCRAPLSPTRASCSALDATGCPAWSALIRAAARVVATCALIALMGASASAQMTFAKDHDRADREFSPRDQLQTSDGGWLLCGEALVVDGGFTTRPYAMRLDALGEVLWHREYQLFSDFHQARALVPLGADAFVMVVELSGLEKTTLVAIDGAGEVLVGLGLTLGVPPFTISEALRTSDGGFLFAGETWRPATGKDLAVLKLRPNGSVEWFREIAGSISAPLFGSDDVASGLAEAGDGSGYFVLGTVEHDAYLAKLDAAGLLVYERSYSITGASVFEAALLRQELPGGGARMALSANLSNDRFPMVFDVDANGEPVGGTAASFPISTTVAVETADGGLVLGGSSLIVPGAQGVRLVKYDAGAALEWAYQYDKTLSFATANPPVLLDQAADGRLFASVAAISGFEPVQHNLRVDSDGDLRCPPTPLDGPFVFELTARTPRTSLRTAPVFSLLLSFASTPMSVETDKLCPTTRP